MTARNTGELPQHAAIPSAAALAAARGIHVEFVVGIEAVAGWANEVAGAASEARFRVTLPHGRTPSILHRRLYGRHVRLELPTKGLGARRLVLGAGRRRIFALRGAKRCQQSFAAFGEGFGQHLLIGQGAQHDVGALPTIERAHRVAEAALTARCGAGPRDDCGLLPPCQVVRVCRRVGLHGIHEVDGPQVTRAHASEDALLLIKDGVRHEAAFASLEPKEHLI